MKLMAEFNKKLPIDAEEADVGFIVLLFTADALSIFEVSFFPFPSTFGLDGLGS